MSGDEVHRLFDGSVLEYTDEDGNLTIPLVMFKALVKELEAADDVDEIALQSDIDGQGEQSIRNFKEVGTDASRTAGNDFAGDETDQDGHRIGAELNANTTNRTQGARYQILDRQYASWPMRRPELMGMVPHEREKARICFMFDWTSDTAESWLAPKFAERGMPWTNNISWHRIRDEDDGWLTIGQVKDLLLDGMEVGVYPRDSTGENITSMADQDPQLIVDFLQAVRREFEDENIPISYLQYRQGHGINSRDVEEDTEQVRPIKSLFISSGDGNIRSNPKDRVLAPQLTNHPSVWSSLVNDSWLDHGALDNPADFGDYLDRVIEVGGEVTFFGHESEIMYDIGESDFEAILDTVVTERNADNLEVMTQSGLQIMPYEAESLNIVADPHADASATFDVSDYWNWTSGSVSVGTDGGTTGSNYYILGTDGEIGFVREGLTPEFPIYSVDVMARAASGTAELRFTNNEQSGNQPVNATTEFEVGESWERVVGTVGNWRDATRNLIRIQQRSGTVHLDDVKIYPV